MKRAAKRSQLNIDLPDEVKRELKASAALGGITLKQLLLKIIVEYVSAQKGSRRTINLPK